MYLWMMLLLSSHHLYTPRLHQSVGQPSKPRSRINHTHWPRNKSALQLGILYARTHSTGRPSERTTGTSSVRRLSKFGIALATAYRYPSERFLCSGRRRATKTPNPLPCLYPATITIENHGRWLDNSTHNCSCTTDGTVTRCVCLCVIDTSVTVETYAHASSGPTREVVHSASPRAGSPFASSAASESPTRTCQR